MSPLAADVGRRLRCTKHVVKICRGDAHRIEDVGQYLGKYEVHGRERLAFSLPGGTVCRSKSSESWTWYTSSHNEVQTTHWQWPPRILDTDDVANPLIFASDLLANGIRLSDSLRVLGSHIYPM